MITSSTRWTVRFDTISMHGEQCVYDMMSHEVPFGEDTDMLDSMNPSHSACQARVAWVQLVKRQFVKCASSHAGARGARAMPVWLLRAARPPAPASPRLMCTCRPSRGGPSAASATSAALSRRECAGPAQTCWKTTCSGARVRISGPTCPTLQQAGRRAQQLAAVLLPPAAACLAAMLRSRTADCSV